MSGGKDTFCGWGERGKMNNGGGFCAIGIRHVCLVAQNLLWFTIFDCISPITPCYRTYTSYYTTKPSVFTGGFGKKFLFTIWKKRIVEIPLRLQRDFLYMSFSMPRSHSPKTDRTPAKFPGTQSSPERTVPDNNQSYQDCGRDTHGR